MMKGLHAELRRLSAAAAASRARRPRGIPGLPALADAGQVRPGKEIQAQANRADDAAAWMALELSLYLRGRLLAPQYAGARYSAQPN